MPFAEFGAEGWAVIITAACVGIGGIITSVVTLILQYYRENAKIVRDQAVAAKVEEVAVETRKAKVEARDAKITLRDTNAATSAKLEGLATVARSTHALVNNAMSIQLRSNAALARKLAALDSSPENVAAAEEADRAYAEHQQRQAAVDAQDGTDAAKKGEMR